MNSSFVVKGDDGERLVDSARIVSNTTDGYVPTRGILEGRAYNPKMA